MGSPHTSKKHWLHRRTSEVIYKFAWDVGIRKWPGLNPTAPERFHSLCRYIVCNSLAPCPGTSPVSTCCFWNRLWIPGPCIGQPTLMVNECIVPNILNLPSLSPYGPPLTRSLPLWPTPRPPQHYSLCMYLCSSFLFTGRHIFSYFYIPIFNIPLFPLMLLIIIVSLLYSLHCSVLLYSFILLQWYLRTWT